MVGLLWNEPIDCYGWREPPKGAGYYFGHDISEKFNIELIINNYLKKIIKNSSSIIIIFIFFYLNFTWIKL